MHQEAFTYVREYLCAHGAQRDAHPERLFRVRSDHIARVCMWAERLLAQGGVEDTEALRLAAVFHDVGYAHGAQDHALHSARVFDEYARAHTEIVPQTAARARFLIAEHSSKASWMNDPAAPMDLVLLMEADLLDEEGAMGIAYDCMSAAAFGATGFEAAYERMLRFEPERLAHNPMRTPMARDIWTQKQAIIRDFMRAFAYDLGIEN